MAEELFCFEKVSWGSTQRSDAAPSVWHVGLVTGAGKSGRRVLVIDNGHPAVIGHDPLAAPHTANIRLVGEAVLMAEAGEHVAVDIGGL